MGHKLTSEPVRARSVHPQITDMAERRLDVRLVPKPEVASSLRRHWHGKKNGRLPDQRSGSPRREEVAPGPTRSAVNQNENGRNTLVKVKC